MQKELYDLFSPKFYSLCRRYSDNDDTAKDILIEGFITVFTSIDHYRGEGSFEGWMRTIFMRKAVLFYRERLRRNHYFEPLEELDVSDASIDPASQIDIKDAMSEAIRRLPNEERLVFNLVAVEEYTLIEAAKELEIPESTVKSRYYRAKNSVKKYLTRRLGEGFLKRYK